MQTRKVTSEITAYIKGLEKRRIPSNAILHHFRVGPGHEGPLPYDPDVVSFYYEGILHFNTVDDLIGRTAVVSVGADHVSDEL